MILKNKFNCHIIGLAAYDFLIAANIIFSSAIGNNIKEGIKVSGGSAMFDLLNNYFSNLKNVTDKYIFTRLIVIAVIIMVLSAAAILAVERKDNFSSFADALWWVIVTTTTVGYGDKYPHSLLGRIIAVILMFFGIGIVSGLTAKFSDLLIGSSRKKELGEVPVEYQEHLIVCGWNKKTKQVINQLLEEEIEKDQLVLLADLDRNPFIDHQLVHFIRGKIDQKEALTRAGVESARAAIILNEEGDDARTVLTVLTIENLNPDIYTIAEISHKENQVHLINAGVDEIIVKDAINSQLLVRTALYSGTSQVIEQLLSNQSGRQIYMLTAPPEKVGTRFIDLLIEDKRETGLILIGLKRKGKILTNPTNNEIIQAQDELIYIAQSEQRQN